MLLSTNTYASDSQRDFYSSLAGIVSDIRKDELVELPAPNRESVKVSTDSVDWDWWVEDLTVAGWNDFVLDGHKLSVRVRFINGGFDQYAKTYKAAPVIQLKDFDKGLTYPYVRVGERRTFVGEKLDVGLEFNKPTIIIRNHLNPTEQKTLQYSELLKAWNELALRTCSDRLGRKICLYSQTMWDGTAWRYGFVVTEDAPLYYTTNLPQEYVELYKFEGGEWIYKPTAFSPATRLAFIYAPNVIKSWRIREMTDEELGEVIVGDRSLEDVLQSNSARTVIP